MQRIRVTEFNRVPALYTNVLELQESLFAQRKANLIDDTLLVLQHAPVYTMGKRGRTTDFRSNMESMLDSGIQIAKTSRGGETTYHGPGQVVMYPIIRLKQFQLGARAYVEALEDAMIDTGAEYGLECKGRIPGKTGVWIKDRKIGAVGVAISGGVTRHGIAFNVCPDLSAYNKIIACGDPVAQATSLENELVDIDLDPRNVAVQLSRNFLKRIQFHGEEVALPDVNKLVDIMGHKTE